MTMTRRRFLAGLAAAGGTMLTGCADMPAQTGRRGYNVRIIDAHAHWYPREFVTLLEKEGPANGARMGKDAAGDPVVLSVPGGTQASTMRRNMTDIDLILKEMDERGVDMYALSMTNPMVYWAPPEFALKLSQAVNDACAAVHLKYPQRFVGTIMLPMQDPKLAVQEARARRQAARHARHQYRRTHQRQEPARKTVLAGVRALRSVRPAALHAQSLSLRRRAPEGFFHAERPRQSV